MLFRSLEYSVNGSSWTPYTIGETISLLDGEKLMFRAGETGNRFFYNDGFDDFYQFRISGEVAAKGNIMSLLNRNCLRKTVGFCEFYRLFWNCQSLTSAPELPATELATRCYDSMFEGCTSLTKAPELPATKLSWGCYKGMFYGCRSLNYVKALFTNKTSDKTTKDWLYLVSPTGTFVKSKDATWDVRGSSGIPDDWNVVTE